MRKLAVIYDPHNLLQFIWYYCTYGTSDMWDALCLPNGFKGEYMSEYCLKSGIFNNVISNNKAYLETSLKEQFFLFLKMAIKFIAAKQETFCYKLVNSFVDVSKYEEIVVLTDHGFISSAFIGLSNRKKIIILEDGKGDYMLRKNSNIFHHMFSFFDWKGFLMANMGYANVGHRYPLKSTKKCIKFCSHPDKMLYKDYKELKKLYDYNNTNMNYYREILEKVYGKLDDYDFEKADTILFTSNLADFITNTEIYKRKLEDYISSKSKNVIIKKHPRDTMNYLFHENIVTQEIKADIPAEVLLPFIMSKNIVFIYTSALMLYIESDNTIECIYFKGLSEKSRKESTYFNYISRTDFEKELLDMNLKKATIIDL